MRLRTSACLAAVFLLCGFTFRLSHDPGILDWGNGEVAPLVVQQLMEGLTVLDGQGKASPGLAERWSASDGFRAFTFHLKAGARWSDGKPVCASQFVDAWVRVLSPKFASPYAHLLFDLENARELHSGKAAPARLGARAVGCDTLEVRLAHPAAYFPELASHWVLFPARLDLIEKYGARWTRPENLVVTGPYALESWVPDKELVLRRNALYHGARAAEETLKAVIVEDDTTALTLFGAGKLDWFRDPPFLEKPRLATRPEYSVFPAFVEYHLGFAFQAKGALDRDARCALSMSIDKRQIPDLLKGGETPAWQLVPPGLSRAQPLAPSFDVERARARWSRSSAKRGPLELHYYAKDVHGVLVEWLQGQWRKNLGVDVKLVKSEPKTYWSRLQRDPPAIFLSGVLAAYPHPYVFLAEFLSDAGGNWGRFSSSAYDSQAVAAAAVDDFKSVAVSKPQKLLLSEECAAIPLYFRKTSSLLARGWEGLRVNPMSYTYLKDVRRRR